MLTTTHGAKKPQVGAGDGPNSLRQAIVVNADLLENLLATGVLALEGPYAGGRLVYGEDMFENGWTFTPSDPPHFYKHLGHIYLSGRASRSSPSASTIFTLPEGYRPNADSLQLVSAANATSLTPTTQLLLRIRTTGAVSVVGGADGVRFDGVFFRAATT